MCSSDLTSDLPFSAFGWINMDDNSGFRLFSKTNSSNREWGFWMGTGANAGHFYVQLYDDIATNRLTLKADDI